MLDKKLRVLAINSLPSHGNAGLKMVMSVLGTRVIPVPSLLLSGIGSMRHLEGFAKFELAFADLIEGAFQLLKQRQEKAIVYIGYLGQANQIPILLDCLEKYGSSIHYIIIDPISGDNGQAYVSADIIQSWPALLEKAHLAFPNLTEVALLSDHKTPISIQEPEAYISRFREKFPALDFVATSLQEGSEVVNRYYEGEEVTNFHHFLHAKNYSGAGDAFASFYILFHFFKNYSPHQALKESGDIISELINQSIQGDSDDLIIEPPFPSNSETYFDDQPEV